MCQCNQYIAYCVIATVSLKAGTPVLQLPPSILPCKTSEGLVRHTENQGALNNGIKEGKGMSLLSKYRNNLSLSFHVRLQPELEQNFSKCVCYFTITSQISVPDLIKLGNRV